MAPRDSTRSELAGLRRIGRIALARFGIEGPRLRLLRHEHNTTFRVDSDSGRYVLRINRPGVHGAETIGSEMAWLHALARDTDLGVPLPVVAPEGASVVAVLPSGDGEPRHAVLLRWQDGRFVDAGLTPGHLRRVAVLQAGLQRHAAHWVRPEGFLRPCVDTLTTETRRLSIGSTGADFGPRPTADDAAATTALVVGLMTAADVSIVDRALHVARTALADLATEPGSAGLIHGDLHAENLLFHDGVARAIDFDDCGWGPSLYDLAVTLWELEGRPHYAELRDAYLDEYARHLPLPARHETLLDALFILRRTQILVWILESRDHSAFRDHWAQWAGQEIAAIADGLQRYKA